MEKKLRDRIESGQVEDSIKRGGYGNSLRMFPNLKLFAAETKVSG